MVIAGCMQVRRDPRRFNGDDYGLPRHPDASGSVVSERGFIGQLAEPAKWGIRDPGSRGIGEIKVISSGLEFRLILASRL